MNLVVNTRILQSHTTGVQRYLLELLARMPELQQIAPARVLAGMRGHAWEQLRLPALCRGNLLWSPSNTGPLAVRNQVVTIHDVVPLDHPEWLNPRFAAWYRFLTPRLARRVRHVIVDSDFTRQRLIAHSRIDPSRITVVHCGVDARFQPQVPGTIAAARAALQMPAGRYVLSVGSLEPRKNLGRLLLAWEHLLPTMPPDVWLVLAGAKGKTLVFADVPALQRLPERVFLSGYVPDELLPAMYAGAMAFVYPSVYEGFGLPPLEAMACGTPVIVGNRTSLPDVVGDAGVVVDPTNNDAIAAGLSALIETESLRAGLIPKGLARAAQFSWDATAQKTRDVLQRAAQA
ncbi:MAG: glycosyltransferase family 4 protein [Sulfuriferula sp.]